METSNHNAINYCGMPTVKQKPQVSVKWPTKQQKESVPEVLQKSNWRLYGKELNKNKE